jgi:hypothetical protein
LRINNQGGLIEIKEEKSNMDIKRRIEKTIEDLKEDFEIILEKLEDNEIDDFELEDLEKMLKNFKKNTWIYA